MYLAYSRQRRSGHTDRTRDVAELEADGRRRAVEKHVAREQQLLAASQPQADNSPTAESPASFTPVRERRQVAAGTPYAKVAAAAAPGSQ